MWVCSRLTMPLAQSECWNPSCFKQSHWLSYRPVVMLFWPNNSPGIQICMRSGIGLFTFSEYIINIRTNLKQSHVLNHRMTKFRAQSLRDGLYSTLLSGCGGGNGVYSFFSLFFCGFFRLLKFFDLNFGKNRSQDSSFRFGSFASSFLIISVWIEENNNNDTFDNSTIYRIYNFSQMFYPPKTLIFSEFYFLTPTY